MKPLIVAATACAIVLALGGPGRAQSRPGVSVAPAPGQVAGRVVRPDGLPQPDAQVVLARRGPTGALRQLPWRAQSAFDGRYEIVGVPPGRYLVLVRALGADVAADGRPGAT
ncbi:MAG TPA: carboxypeptidase-like regulatory domain-containing protein, partial [Vicinamibacterales bacterium]